MSILGTRLPYISSLGTHARKRIKCGRVHTYYGKHCNVWRAQPKQASWMVQGILKAQKYFLEAGFQERDVLNMESYSIKTVSQKMRGELPKMDWRRLVRANNRAPKWKSVLNLALTRRLLTKARLAQWGCVESLTCTLCKQGCEDIEHLFFECSYAAAVWSKMLSSQGILRQCMNWQGEVVWAQVQRKGKNSAAQVFRMTLAGSVNYIWQEWNLRLFQGKERNAEGITKQVIRDVHIRGSLFPRLTRKPEELNMYL
ncbi:uncharacterized protein LOC132624567 [Lycium barbarum]|uniref:uncharacterized protein LOC132624567 n=1 Tax=Lycium barbarum TaxID=112863 RepID=UPI00293ECB76|nr:uncharacterized protein LOC132624567 [Lycium barbarum]